MDLNIYSVCDNPNDLDRNSGFVACKSNHMYIHIGSNKYFQAYITTREVRRQEDIVCICIVHCLILFMQLKK